MICTNLLRAICTYYFVTLDTFRYKFVSKIQIVVHQFVRRLTANKILKSEKKGPPLNARYAEIMASAKFYRRFYRWRKTTWVKPIAIRFVITLVPWVINQYCIWCQRASNDNPVKCVGLGLGAQHFAVFIMVKITLRKKW